MKKIVLLSGDGIGPEIMAEAEKILHLIQEKRHWQAEMITADIGGCAVDKYGEPYPQQTQMKVHSADAVLLACIGGPQWDKLERSKRPESGLLALRADLQLFANLRPVQVADVLADYSPLKSERVKGLDILIVRELTGGIYFGQPRAITRNLSGEREGINTLRYSEHEIRRVATVAFKAAMQRRKRLCSVDKMNVLESSQLWREVVTDLAQDYPEVELTHMLVDNAAMQLIRNPHQFDVIVTGNLFGDILSDEASMLTGSIGLLPSASLGHDSLGLFEPIHGSAPDIAGRGIANPYAMLFSVAMMLRYSFQENVFAAKLEEAIKNCLNKGIYSTDIAAEKENVYTTSAIGDAVCDELAVLLN